ncbi:hypothetical protein AJ80_01135 [Polytolypa hystricis UAMH7299]|uniref:Glc8 protein n=1 Tax=Polytolypa hystricis (strain UAMH7299) TaxID=1447883 RepID=A0A2B7Z221_POLH7|nr:hypothetical protein AJ80_01135 [Polytolypa hystricis UAMH7299]
MRENAPTKLQSSDEVSNQRPKGILKNSYSGSSISLERSPTSPIHTIPSAQQSPLDNKELTLQNTLQNAGRRHSSARRHSSVSNANGGGSVRSRSGSAGGGGSGDGDDGDGSLRLKWDEANLYLTEQDRTSTMKIDEPKTPYAPHYNMDDDEDEDDDVEMGGIDAEDLAVDELDMYKAHKQAKKKYRVLEEDIPGLDLGEPEEPVMEESVGGGSRITGARSGSVGSEGRPEKHVVVGEGGDGGSGSVTDEDMEKHHMFEEKRKKHYEMSGIKNLLGHPETLDEADEDDDDERQNQSSGQPPPMPKLPGQFSKPKQ